MVLLKIDGNGNILWLRQYESLGSNMPYAVCKAQDGGYIVLESSSYVEVGDVLSSVLKIDENGECPWEKSWSISGADVF